jgi:membrane-associated phospholipid phosphatase
MHHEEQRRVVLRRWMAAVIVLQIFVLLTLLDPWLWRVMAFDPGKTLEGKDWWQVLRQFGSLLTWVIIATCIVLHDVMRRGGWTEGVARAGAFHRGLMVFLSAALGGGLAEVLKGLSRRGRPLGDGSYRFGWFEDVHAYGLASSHAGVAFGGAIMMGWLFPGTRVPLLLLASGTAMTRLAVGAHYATDVYVAILLAYVSAWVVWRVFGKGEVWGSEGSSAGRR